MHDKYDTWSASNKDEIVKHVNKYHSIYLHGKYGTGKTHFLKWITRQYRKQGHYVYYGMFADVARVIKDEFNLRKNGIYNTRIEDKMKSCKILCLDDLGNENMTNYTHELLVTVINHRYEHNKATFITSNYTPKELYEIYLKQIGEIKAGQLISRIMTFGEKQLISKNWRKELEYKE